MARTLVWPPDCPNPPGELGSFSLVRPILGGCKNYRSPLVSLMAVAYRARSALATRITDMPSLFCKPFCSSSFCLAGGLVFAFEEIGRPFLQLLANHLLYSHFNA